MVAVIAACAFALCFGLSARGFAADRPTLAGVWSESIMTERWNIGQWGDQCGPKPISRDIPGGQATVVEEGVELVITSSDRTFRTAACYEWMPGLVQSSHSVTQRSWQTRCVSKPNDPRQTTLVTNLTATDTTMSLDETGAYQFVMKGQNCTASARRSRTYRLALRQGETPPVATAPPGVTPEPTATATPQTPAPPVAAPTTSPTPFSRPSTAGKCAEPGDPARLEVTPVRKLMRPGETFTFRTRAFDASGCPVPPKVSWAVATPGAKVTVSPAGVVTVADDAEDGTVEMSIAFVGKFARVRVEVATPARYEALLSTTASSDAGETEEAATIVASGSLGTNSAVAQDGARARKTTFVIIIGVLALGLATLGFFLMRRTAPSPLVAAESTPEPIAYIAVPGGAPPPPALQGRPFGGRAMACPSCRSEFPAGSTFCPRDGNRLVEAAPTGGSTALAGGICPTCGRGYDPGVRTCPVHGDELVPAAAYRPRAAAVPVPERGKICPSCGGRYGGEATFCGKDGTALVLVN